ncbi:MAG: Gfo/Idh/MocA family protein [Halobacteriales archaeon]
MEETGFAVVGVRNFADSYIDYIRTLEGEGLRLSGVVIRDQVKNAERAAELRSEGVRVFDSYDELLSEGREYVDVVGIPTSIPTHDDLTIEAMERGYDVLMEKPPTPTVEQMDNLRRAAAETGKMCSVGFQFIHSPSVRELKEMILAGELGELDTLACWGKWRRVRSYYERNPWAGRATLDGELVLDGPMHNALAHYLNNMLFLAGDSTHEAAELETVKAELYRGHSYIESPDTSCLHAETVDGTDIYFYVTYAPEETSGPVIEVEGSEGSATWWMDETAEVETAGGESVELDSSEGDPHHEVFRATARYYHGEQDELWCTLDNSRPFVVAINGAYESAGRIREIPGEYVREFEDEDGEYVTVVDGVDDVIAEAFEDRKLYSETGAEWTTATEPVDVRDYERFSPF